MTTRVLVVEDNQADARLLAEILSEVPGRPFVLTRAETLAGALALVGDNDVVLLDLSLPDAHGGSTVERMVAGARAKPIVVLTGNNDEHAAMEALQAGAQDYLLKAELSASNVARSIRYAIERKRAEWAEVARAKSDENAARTRFVANTLREVTRALDLDGALFGLARSLLPRLGELCIVDLLQDDGRLVGVAHAGRHELADGILTNFDAAVAFRAIETRASARFDAGNTTLDARCSELVSRFGVRSFLVTPLVARDRVLGTITMGSGRNGYSDDDLLLGDEVAGNAALAIDNARLHDLSRQAVRSRDELLSIVSHDLRNPLNVMALGLHLVEKRTEEERQPNIERIRRALEKTQRLIADLLDVARVDAGTLDVSLARVDVIRVLDDAFELLQPLAAQKKVLLVRDYAATDDLGAAEMDTERIAQVLSNLLGNAVKFTPVGGTIHLGAHRLGTDRLRIEVRDSGPGIDREHVAHVFDRFWQRERRTGGVGLGLAIAKGIVEAHGGTIHVESTPGMGASFWFTLRASSPA